MKIKKTAACLLIFSTFNAVAGGLFLDASYMSSSITIAEQTFKPSLTQLGIGWQFTDRFAMELMQATKASDDSVATVTAEIKSMNSVQFRYGSPVSSDTNVYVMLGYSELELIMQGITLQSNDVFADTSWGAGFEERLIKDSNLRLHFDYTVHYSQDDLVINSVQLGLRYVFE